MIYINVYKQGVENVSYQLFRKNHEAHKILHHTSPMNQCMNPDIQITIF